MTTTCDRIGTVILVMFTSSSNPSDREVVAGFDVVKDYIVKMPESAEQLREQIARLVVAQ